MVRILVFGFGSVGRRHAENFSSLGCKVLICDTLRDRASQAEKMGFQSVSPSLTDLRRLNLDASVIATPPDSHYGLATRLIEAQIPVLIEKPVTRTLDEAKQIARILRSSPSLFMLGYTWRWWPSIARIREILISRELGKPLHVDMFMSAHLADWHPWEAYEDFYMAHAEQGGGALLDESHWIDLMVWFFGTPKSIFAKVGKKSDLNISSDDSADILCFYEDGMTVSVHLDLFGRPHKKSIRITGEAGTLNWSSDPDCLQVWSKKSSDGQVQGYGGERNEMFLREGEEFLASLNGEYPPSCGITDGVEVMKVVEAARMSSRLQKVVNLADSFD